MGQFTDKAKSLFDIEMDPSARFKGIVIEQISGKELASDLIPKLMRLKLKGA